MEPNLRELMDRLNELDDSHEMSAALQEHFQASFEWLDGIESAAADESGMMAFDPVNLLSGANPRRFSLLWDLSGDARADGGKGSVGWTFDKATDALDVRLQVVTVGGHVRTEEGKPVWHFVSRYDSLGLHAQLGVRALGRPIPRKRGS